ncbi:hypothetical protein NLI96_g2001 [Meripilus lineatus]|uniref:Myb-like domain-containing protein n=1 Tax=Meripilus lineatus TaxID=2056292 RepID=A0AAD5V9G7_9APHY|nr:hypothetical protein NLI96_g2001 [Physisporinus lineatus]
MSTRVQKGSTVFRPIAKPRARQVSAPSTQEAHHASTSGASKPLEPLVESSDEISRSLGASASLHPPQPPQFTSTLPRFGGKGELSVDAPHPVSQALAQPVSHSASQPVVQNPAQTATTARDTLSQPPTIAVSIGRPPSVHVQAQLPAHVARSDAFPIPTSTPIPTPIAIPSSSDLRPTDTSTRVPHPVEVNPPSGSTAPSTLNDVVQIDPALLEAVVTALQHVEGTQTTQPTVAHPGESPAPQVLEAVAGEEAQTSNTQPPESQPSKPPRKRTRKSTQTSNAERKEGSDEQDTEAPPKKKRVTRKRVRSATTEPSNTEDNEESPGSPTQRKRKKSSTPKRGRKSRPPSPPPFDANADPGEDLDPTAVTMGALCDDPGRGRISSKAAQILTNHATWRTANREKRARMRAIMEARKYGRDLEAEEENAASAAKTAAGSPAPNEGTSTAAVVDETQDQPDTSSGAHGFDYSQEITTSRYNVQVRIGPNGETIIDEDSLFVDRNQEDDTADYTHIEESDTSKFVNSSTYSKKLRGSRWSSEETELFFDALSQFGENYELISYVLPGRDRKACKNKFKAEDRKNPARITHCLNNRRPYGTIINTSLSLVVSDLLYNPDIQTLSRMTGKDFSGPTPVIRTPTPQALPEEPPEPEPVKPAPTRKKRRTPAAEDGLEIVGNLSDIEKDDDFES